MVTYKMVRNYQQSENVVERMACQRHHLHCVNKYKEVFLLVTELKQNRISFKHCECKFIYIILFLLQFSKVWQFMEVCKSSTSNSDYIIVWIYFHLVEIWSGTSHLHCASVCLSIMVGTLHHSQTKNGNTLRLLGLLHTRQWNAINMYYYI